MSPRAPFSMAVLPLAITAAVLSCTAYAQSSTQQLEALTIYADTYRNTASKSALEAEETPQGITIVEKKELEQRAVESLSEALRYTPGVTTEVRGGAVTRLDILSIRGFQNAEHYYDGLPLLYNSGWLQPQIDAAAIQQVEVFKGPTSVLYGAMPPGGMVNIISNQPNSEEKSSIALKLGSRNFAGVEFQSQGNINNKEDLTYSLTGLTNKSDSQSDVVKEQRSMFSGSINWQASDDTLVNFNFYRQSDPDQGAVSGLPAKGSVFSNINGDFSPGLYTGDINFSKSSTDVTMAGYKINHSINSEWTFLHNARYTSSNTQQQDLYSSFLAPDESTLYRGAYALEESNYGFAMDNQLAGIVKFGDVEHNLLLGADLKNLSAHVSGATQYASSGLVPTLDLFNPDYDQVDPNTIMNNAGRQYDYKVKTKQVGIYLQDQIRIDKLVIIAGTRYDDYKTTASSVTETAKEITSRLGVMYSFDNGIAPFASYSESFEPESGTDLAGNPFEASRAKQIEIGVKYSPIESDTAATLSLFKINKDKNLTDDPNDNIYYAQIQTGEVESKGIELSVKHYFTDALSVDFNATIMDVVLKDDTDYEGNTPIWLAEKTASLWVNYDLPASVLKNSNVAAGIRYIGNTQIDAANSATAPSYSVVDLAFNMDLNNINPKLSGGSFALSVNNVFDKESYICYNSVTCWEGAERSIEAKFKYEF